MTALRHVGIVVRDLGRSLKFYRDLLGFEELRSVEEEGEFLDAILGLRGAKVRTVKLRGAEGGIVELLAFRSPQMEISNSPPLVRSGPTHIAVTVDNIERLYGSLKEAGIECTTPPRTSPDGGARVTFCRDPDGTFVELVQAIRG